MREREREREREERERDRGAHANKVIPGKHRASVSSKAGGSSGGELLCERTTVHRIFECRKVFVHFQK